MSSKRNLEEWKQMKRLNPIIHDHQFHPSLPELGLSRGISKLTHWLAPPKKKKKTKTKTGEKRWGKSKRAEGSEESNVGCLNTFWDSWVFPHRVWVFWFQNSPRGPCDSDCRRVFVTWLGVYFWLKKMGESKKWNILSDNPGYDRDAPSEIDQTVQARRTIIVGIEIQKSPKFWIEFFWQPDERSSCMKEKAREAWKSS